MSTKNNTAFADCERLAHYLAVTFHADRHAIRDGLRSWRDTAGIAIDNAALGAIADTVSRQYVDFKAAA